jgi:hypothetical protein
LTKLQLEFAREYAVDLNGTAALMRARKNLGEKGGANSAAVTASKWLRLAKVRAACREFERENFAQLAAVSGATPEVVLQRVFEIANVDPAELKNPDGTYRALHEIPPAVRRAIAAVDEDEEVTRDASGKETRVVKRRYRLVEKNPALTNLMKHFKLLTGDFEQTVNNTYVFDTGEMGTPGSARVAQRAKEAPVA